MIWATVSSRPCSCWLYRTSPSLAAAAAAKSLPSSNSVQPHGWKPTRFPHPWDSPGKNTGVGCHVLLQCMKVKSESEVLQSSPSLSDPMDCSLPGSSIHGIFQERVLEWGAIAFSETASESMGKYIPWKWEAKESSSSKPHIRQNKH